MSTGNFLLSGNSRRPSFGFASRNRRRVDMGSASDEDEDIATKKTTGQNAARAPSEKNVQVVARFEPLGRLLLKTVATGAVHPTKEHRMIGVLTTGQVSSPQGIGEKTWEAWKEVQRLFDEQPDVYRQLVTRIEAMLTRVKSAESPIDVLAKMILRCRCDPDNYTSSAIRWAAGKVGAEARRILVGRSKHREEGTEAYHRHLKERRQRESEELESTSEAKDLVDVFCRQVVPTFSSAMRQGIRDVMDDVGCDGSKLACIARSDSSASVRRRTRFWRKREAKKLAYAHLQELGA